MYNIQSYIYINIFCYESPPNAVLPLILCFVYIARYVMKLAEADRALFRARRGMQWQM